MKSLTPSDERAVLEVLDKVCDKDVHKAIKYVSPTHVVRATRAKSDSKYERGTMRVTLHIGKPNFDEREFISDCKKVREKFPIRGVILKFHPQKKK